VNLLIVDDHPVVAEYLRNAAGRAVPDAVVRIAGDLDAAFESMRENPAELVLLDLGLPECGGVESVLRFRKEYPDARVVVISSEDERNAIRGCIALGAAAGRSGGSEGGSPASPRRSRGRTGSSRSARG
jgi:two-component system response regulator FimZ (fimbrial Z protein)/two-component system response regulator EvgA